MWIRIFSILRSEYIYNFNLPVTGLEQFWFTHQTFLVSLFVTFTKWEIHLQNFYNCIFWYIIILGKEYCITTSFDHSNLKTVSGNMICLWKCATYFWFTISTKRILLWLRSSIVLSSLWSCSSLFLNLSQ